MLLTSKIKRFTGVIVIFILMTGCKGSPPDPIEANPDAVRLLKDWLGSDLQITKDSGKEIIAYCPDNTCEEFSVNKRVNLEPMAKFALIYLFYVSDYIYLSKDRHSQQGVLVTKILKNNTDGCKSKNKSQLVSCVLLSMVKEYGIRSTFIRYDEEKRNETPIDLSQQLKRLQ